MRFLGVACGVCGLQSHVPGSYFSPSHDGTRRAVFVSLGVFDGQSDARGFGESFVDTAVLHGGAFCGKKC